MRDAASRAEFVRRIGEFARTAPAGAWFTGDPELWGGRARPRHLEPGKLADLVLIDRDLSRIAPAAIRGARVLLTMVGGQIVYERPPAGGAGHGR